MSIPLNAEPAELTAHSAASVAAEVISLVAPIEPAVAVAAAAGGAAPEGLAASMQVATAAAQNLPADTLLSLAQGAALLHAPLTAALAEERLRQATTIMPKEEWQALAAQARSFKREPSGGAPCVWVSLRLGVLFQGCVAVSCLMHASRPLSLSCY